MQDDKRTIGRLRNGLEKILMGISASLLIGLVLIVLLAVVYRKLGHSLIWYDELASLLLVWLTYIGSAAAASQRSHLGFDGFVKKLPALPHRIIFFVGEALIIGFFVLIAIYGIRVQVALQGEHLISLPWFPLTVSQAIIPVAAILFILSEILSIPQAIRQAS
ncbi:MAG: TRAP transporter small permease subunit [Bacteroidota bacterium]